MLEHPKVHARYATVLDLFLTLPTTTLPLSAAYAWQTTISNSCTYITYLSASQIVLGCVSYPTRFPATRERLQSSAFFGSDAIIFILGLILCKKNVDGSIILYFIEDESKYSP